jgi:hypothetical protein
MGRDLAGTVMVAWVLLFARVRRQRDSHLLKNRA